MASKKRQSKVKPGSNPMQRAKPTKPGQSAYREEQEARRKRGVPYNPNNKPRKKGYEPGVMPTPGSNPLQRAARRQQSSGASNRTPLPLPKPKPKANYAKPTAKPNPRMSGEGVSGRRDATFKSKVRKGNNSKGRTNRLESALRSVKKRKY